MTNLIRTIFGRKTKATDSPSPPIRDLAALTAPLQREALHVVPSDEPSLSHLGGDPLLPSALAWPQRDGTRLRFLARLSLTELQAKAATPWLPQSGALLFFYDDDKQPWGFDPADRGGWSVLHVPVASSRATDESADLLPHTSVTLRPIRVLPSSERAEVEALKLSDQELDRYSELEEERFQGLPKHQLLGLPRPVQGDSMELECQLASHGVNCGTPAGYATARAKELADGAHDWRLLFQMDSDDDLGVMWGDLGTLYFWVQESAARKGDFSNVWLVLQCS